MQPDDQYEQRARAQGHHLIAGIDEVGRGPISGPVTAAAVIFHKEPPTGLRDSKRLSAAQRIDMVEKIHSSAHVSVAHASVAEIDDINILNATYLAMTRALEGLPVVADFALIDGNRLPTALTIPAQAVVKGDNKSVSIAAASIIAKVTRDGIMQHLGEEFPHYLWHQNAGYPTKAHLEALKTHGVTPHHRVSFKPVHNILCREK